MTTHADLLLGAYAMAPEDPGAEEVFYTGVADLGVRGLELPLPLEGAPSLEPAWIDRNVRPAWDLLVTCIPTVIGRLGSGQAYGLASDDQTGRALAVADVARARDLALRLADQHGRQRVVAIQVHSAPGPVGGSRDAFARSLDQILAWDLAGADVLVEHCDALVAGQHPAKGFWSLQDEIAAVRTVGGPGRLGISINWGRSAIEGRSIRTPVEHVQAAVEAGLLRAVVLSGATDAETAWGPAWGDAHIPPRGDDPALASASLLGRPEIAAMLRAAGSPAHVAVKVSVRPKNASVPARLAVARAALGEVAQARPSARSM
jgi:sugar phosphate isomerase/epimerase